MANFQGYLLKATKTGQVFPHQYIVADSFSSTPNQREELKAYRDDNTRNLTRVTAYGKKSVFSFTTRDNLHLKDIEAIQNFFNTNEEDAAQRKISLEYWDDELLTYKTGTFYRPNLAFPKRRITSNDIIYKAITLEFIEY